MTAGCLLAAATSIADPDAPKERIAIEHRGNVHQRSMPRNVSWRRSRECHQRAQQMADYEGCPPRL